MRRRPQWPTPRSSQAGFHDQVVTSKRSVADSSDATQKRRRGGESTLYTDACLPDILSEVFTLGK